ncbi:MAG: substrate-binding domain-containing protein [Flavonifractor plautii]
MSVDNLAAAREVVSPGRAGHRRIGFIGADNDFVLIARRQGYLDGLRVLNIPPREDDQTFAGRDYSFSSGVEAARRLLARPERPTALFCISDVLALGAVQAARELGLRVPEDLSVVGFDDVERRDGPPQATTVRQPCYELGRTAGSFCSPRFRAAP